MALVSKANTPERLILPGLSEIANHYDAFILDIWGVIHNGIEPFPGTVEVLKELKDAGKKTCFLSNTPRPAEGTIKHLDSMGITRDMYDEIVTSGEATIAALSDPTDEFHASFGRDCWFIGPPGAAEILSHIDVDVVHHPDQASFILNSISGTTPEDYRALMSLFEHAVELDLPMVCANPDLVVNVGNVQYECAGTFALHYENMGGRVEYHGKPHSYVYERCHNLLGEPDKAKLCAVGDAFHTDIAGAHNFGIDSVLNLVGIHWDEVADHAQLGLADQEKLTQLLAEKEQNPTHIMAGFSW